MAIAQRKQGFLLEFEAEMRAKGQVPDPRPVSDNVVHQAVQTRPPRAVGDRGSNPRDGRDFRDMRDRAGTKPDDAPAYDNRECHICKKVGHIARDCTALGASSPPKPPASRLDAMAAHKTTGAVCGSCGKPGHTIAQCWSAHPELVPESLMKKRQSAMSATARKRRRAAKYVSPNYHFQGMALTYRRPHYAMVQKRSTRPSISTEATRQAAEEQPTRRVHFAPPTPAPHMESTPEMTDPLFPTQETQPTTPGFESDEYAFKGQLPQSFPHGLPISSLEPGTSDLQFPLSKVFPKALLGDGATMMQESPHQTMVQLRHATTNLQQLVAELSASLWEKATLFPTTKAHPVRGACPSGSRGGPDDNPLHPRLHRHHDWCVGCGGICAQGSDPGHGGHKSDVEQEFHCNHGDKCGLPRQGHIIRYGKRSSGSTLGSHLLYRRSLPWTWHFPCAQRSSSCHGCRHHGPRRTPGH